jgi:hypothetical protein
MGYYWRLTFFFFAKTFGELPNTKIWEIKNPKLLELLSQYLTSGNDSYSSWFDLVNLFDKFEHTNS